MARLPRDAQAVFLLTPEFTARQCFLDSLTIKKERGKKKKSYVRDRALTVGMGTWNCLEQKESEVYRVLERNEFSKNSQVETEKALDCSSLK